MNDIFYKPSNSDSFMNSNSKSKISIDSHLSNHKITDCRFQYLFNPIAESKNYNSFSHEESNIREYPID